LYQNPIRVIRQSVVPSFLTAEQALLLLQFPRDLEFLAAADAYLSSIGIERRYAPAAGDAYFRG
jgi:hypothetical protein